MSHGLAFTDALILTDELTDTEAVVLARWQDGLRRDDGYRKVAESLGIHRDDAHAAFKSLIKKGFVRVRKGGNFPYSRYIVHIDPRFDRRNGTDEHFVIMPGPLITQIIRAGEKHRPFRLRLIALYCRDQIRRGAAFTSDAEAARLLHMTIRAVQGARRQSVRAGILVLHDRYKSQPIYVIPDAFVKPDVERFRPEVVVNQNEPLVGPEWMGEAEIAKIDLRSEEEKTDDAWIMAASSPEELNRRSWIVRHGGTRQGATGVRDRGPRGYAVEGHEGYAIGGQSTTSTTRTTNTTLRPSAVEGGEETDVRAAQAESKDEAAPKGAGEAGVGINAGGEPSAVAVNPDRVVELQALTENELATLRRRNLCQGRLKSDPFLPVEN